MSPFPDVQYHFIPSLPFLSSPKVLSSFSISEKHKGLAPSLSRKQMQRMEKMFGSMGAGTLIWQKHERRNKWWETGAVEVWGIDENRRGENEDGGVGGVYLFISCFSKMNFKAHLLRVMFVFTAKRRPINTESERTRSPRHLLCGHKQRKWTVMQTKEGRRGKIS